MFAACKSRPCGRVRTLFLASFVAVLSSSLILAQKPSPKPSASPTYDLKTEVKIKGTVDEVKLAGTDSKTKVTRLVVKSGPESIEVALCPKSFLDDMGVSFSKGDELEITGSKVKHDDLNEVLARQIVRGNDTVVLRDQKGKPVWN